MNSPPSGRTRVRATSTEQLWGTNVGLVKWRDYTVTSWLWCEGSLSRYNRASWKKNRVLSKGGSDVDEVYGEHGVWTSLNLCVGLFVLMLSLLGAVMCGMYRRLSVWLQL